MVAREAPGTVEPRAAEVLLERLGGSGPPGAPPARLTALASAGPRSYFFFSAVSRSSFSEKR